VEGLGDAPNADVADAIRWAWLTCGADIVNGSWSQQVPSTDIADAIDEGASEGRGGTLGTVFVFSGGNYSDREGGVLYPVAYPAAHPAAIAVGAINRFGAVTNYSPYGASGGPQCPPGMYCAPPVEPDGKVAPELVAPSGHYEYLGSACPTAPADSAPDVYTTDLVGGLGCMPGDYLADFSGTSASAPQVAAAAALLLSTEPGLSQAQVKDRLLDGADTWGPYAEFGDGKLNIGRVLGVSIPPITSLDIVGQSPVRPDDYCLWWAQVSGGTPPYTAYNWYRNGIWVASGSSVFLATGTSSFTLRVDVEDSWHQTATTSRSITISGSAQYCFQ
jgi:subtilisin family serine protease